MLKVEDIAEDEILFYDIETDSEFAPYCELKMIGAQEGFNGEPFLVESWGQKKRFKEMVADPDILKVAFNQFNFDNLVLWRHGFPVCETNSHDLFLIAKTVAPRLPAYGLKFINWYIFGDMHLPEMYLHEWMKQNRVDNMWQAPKEFLEPYCLYDVHPQTTRLFRTFWEVVQRPEHWRAYTEVELPAGIVMEEIMLRGGEYLDENLIDKKLKELTDEKLGWEQRAWELSDGKVDNPNSVKQVGEYLRDEDKIELELTDKGNFQLRKIDLLDFIDIEDADKDRSKIMRCLFEVRRINNTASYYRNYKAALEYQLQRCNLSNGWIPKQYSLSGARTRRILSNSYFKLNFQNPNDAAKEVQVVPKGWLGWWIDATQIENVVHIYESNDRERRKDYEADPDWNEYVWLCNQVLRTQYTKEELEELQFPANPIWSVYKGYKTIKLAVNFGMGVTKYSKQTKLPYNAAQNSFNEIHRACPAIRKLQKRVAEETLSQGFVTDVFGHQYAAKEPYKLVAYLIQGTGTGSLPKVQLRANYDTLHQWDTSFHGANGKKGGDIYIQVRGMVIDRQRKVASFGVMTGTTHDEQSGRISLLLEKEQIIATLQELMFNMTERFSPLFDNIPLRAKLYLSRTTTSEREEVDVKDTKKIESFL